VGEGWTLEFQVAFPVSIEGEIEHVAFFSQGSRWFLAVFANKAAAHLHHLLPFRVCVWVWVGGWVGGWMLSDGFRAGFTCLEQARETGRSENEKQPGTQLVLRPHWSKSCCDQPRVALPYVCSSPSTDRSCILSAGSDMCPSFHSPR